MIGDSMSAFTNDKREKIMKKWFKNFFKDMDRIALGFGWTSKKWKKRKLREWKETMAIEELKSLLKVHSCGAIPRINTSSNSEYPDGIYVECSCGMRTREFVQFLVLNPTRPGTSSYSELESVREAVLTWNKNRSRNE